MHIIPTDSALPHWEQDTELDGVIYRLRFAWSGRDLAWYLTLKTHADETIRSAIKLVPHFPLLRKVRHPRRPPGELTVVTTAPITRHNLGTEARLVYLSTDDIARVIGG